MMFAQARTQRLSVFVFGGVEYFGGEIGFLLGGDWN